MEAELCADPPSLSPDAYQRFVALCAKVDALFSAIYKAHREHMQCGAGCAQCCYSQLSVTLVEAVHLARGLAALSPEVRGRLAERARSGDSSRCAALDDDEQCALYAWRPLICRSHGAPLRRYETRPAARGEDTCERERGASGSSYIRSKVRLPVIEVCDKNFAGGRALDAVEPGMIFDQTTLATVLGAIAAAFADEVGAPRDTRVPIASLLADPEQYFVLE